MTEVTIKLKISKEQYKQYEEALQEFLDNVDTSGNSVVTEKEI